LLSLMSIVPFFSGPNKEIKSRNNIPWVKRKERKC
jgi:hypothetical protein